MCVFIQCGWMVCRVLIHNTEFQNSDSKVLSQAGSFSERGALCNCTGHLPLKLAVFNLDKKAQQNL